jgi:hypothetical protein
MSVTAKTLGTLVLALVVLLLYYSIFIFGFYPVLYLALALTAVGMVVMTYLSAGVGGSGEPSH